MSTNSVLRYRSIRQVTLAISTAMFPVTFYYLSPVIPMNGAVYGVVTGSISVFLFLMLAAVLLGRAFCSWLCPAGGIQDQIGRSRRRRIRGKGLGRVKFVIWGAWIAGLLILYRSAGGLQGFSFGYLTESGWSTTSIQALIAYTSVVLAFILISLAIGRRAACHGICWISPFMVLGMKFGAVLSIPRLMPVDSAGTCVSCGKCTQACPMSIEVEQHIPSGAIRDVDCINCGECAAACPRDTIRLKMYR